VNAPTQVEKQVETQVEAPAASMPRLEDFPYRLTDNVRFADLDPNQHVNNAVYATYFETGRVTLVKDRTNGLMPDGLTWILVRLDIHFRAELRWPGRIELGLGVARLGRTSVTFDQVVFSDGECVASAQAVTVLIDDMTRKPTPLTPDIIEKLQPWLRRGVKRADGTQAAPAEAQ
jgi:acyl-CoA thioester hydrolase